MSTPARRKYKARMIRAGRNLTKREALVKRAQASPFVFAGGHWLSLKRGGFSKKEALTLELQRLRTIAGNVPDAELREIARLNVYHAYDKGCRKEIDRHYTRVAYPSKVPKPVRRQVKRFRREYSKF